MNVNGFKDADLEKGNMAIILILSYVFSVMFSLFLSGCVIHQVGAFQLFLPELRTDPAVQEVAGNLFSQYGDKHRTFFHGALHGSVNALFCVLPIIAINALFERRGWAYIFIHFGYWFICFTLIGAVLCKYLVYAEVG